MKSVVSLAICILLSVGGTFGQTTTFHLKVVEDVTLERGTTNYNYLPYLIVGLHPGYPKKRSLLKFEDVPGGCRSVNSATMYIYYVYSHKASFYSNSRVPFITRTIRAHRVLKSWTETQATSTKRDSNNNWRTPWLGLDGIDATSYSTGQTTISANYPREGNFVQIDVTSAARAWKSGSPNYGVVIWATNENREGRDIRFASKSETDSSRHAFIVLHCSSDNTGTTQPPTTSSRPTDVTINPPIELDG